MAAIRHVPTDVAVRVPDVKAQPCAVPPLTIAYVTEPLLEPPVELNVGVAVYADPE